MQHFRKIILAPAIVLGLLSGAVACNEKFDDSSIWEAIRGQEARLAALESLCGRINSEITVLSSVVNALSAGDMVTSVTPVIIDGREAGYTIAFLKNLPITIMNGKPGNDGADGKDGEDGKDGKDGKDGRAPVIGIGTDEDGNWYWTLDGEWMRDADGNRLRANGKDGTDGADGKNGTDGKDGRTPLIRIDGGWWCVSYDEGATWEKIGKVDEYPDGQPCTLIAALEDSEESLAIRLHDGSTIVLPKYRPAPPLEIHLDYGIREMAAGETVEVGYSLSGAAGKATLTAIAQGGWKASVVMAGADTGQIRITAPIPYSVQETVVLACDSEGRMAMESLSFAERESPGYSLNPTGDSLEVFVADTSFIMVKVPHGTFVMGNDSQYENQGTSYGYTDPRHKVTLTRDFWIGTGTMGPELLGRFASVNQDLVSYAGSGYQSDTKNFIGISDVETVLEGIGKDCGMKFRLPTEAEAEYAFLGGYSRGGTQVSDWMSYNKGWFSWGFNISADAEDPVGPPSTTPMSWPADDSTATLEEKGYDSWYKVRKSSGNPHRRYTTRRYPIIVVLDDWQL